MKHLYALFLLTLICINVTAQISPVAQVIRCHTAESMKDYRKKHPMAESDQQFEQWMNAKIRERQSSQRVAVAYTIPIIFHIIHNGEAVGTGSNISATQIQQQLIQLNKDYANLSGSVYGVAANTEVQFCLAKQRPDGTVLAEAGIERIDRNAKGWTAPPYDGMASNSYVDQTIIPSTIWDPYKYFNVWTIDLSGGLLGKATFPVSSGLPGLSSGETDTHAGVFVAYQSVGSSTSPGPYGATFGWGRTLTHESGHFFGLRHIWGDATCGDDYCADTPPQNAATSGCPAAGTLNGCTPSVAKMFENYMDYTNDNCVNTFTNDQKTRIQTVMANSPRRITLATSDACLTPASNAIRFTTNSTTVTETGTGACPRSKTVTLTLKVSSAANNNATVTFTKGGTATDNVDYTISPASVSYTNGDNTDKTVTVTILDDGAVESTETIIIGFTITGTGVVNGTSNLTHTITITDDDIVPAINNAGTVTLLNENFGTGSTNGLPANWQSIDLLGTSTNLFVGSYASISGFTGKSAYVSQTPASAPAPNTYNANNESEVMLRTPQIVATGLTNVKTTFRYKCNGEVSGGTVYDFGSLLYSTNGTTFYFLANGSGNPYIYQGQSTATTVSNLVLNNGLNNNSFYLGFYWYNDNSIGNNPPFAIDSVAVVGDAKKIETVAAQTGSENVFAGQDVYLYSGSGNLMARITNPSVNLGCLTGTISQAGTGQTPVTTSAGTYNRTQKVITISPAIANSTATYTGSLYFTSAELAAWGASKLNLKILKVKDGVSLASTLNASNAEIVTPISATENVSAGYIEYRANFTGFSQFMLIDAAATLPVTLLSFNAYAQSKSIKLQWKTTAESGMRGFTIERSINGSDYENIGFVAAVNSGNADQLYTFIDRNVKGNINYHYRLRMQEYDRTEKFSEVRRAMIASDFTQVTIKPNPVKNVLTLYISSPESAAGIQIFNLQGQTVYESASRSLNNGQMNIDISQLASGIYTLVVTTNKERTIEKFIKE
jgi:hypothetical protein